MCHRTAIIVATRGSELATNGGMPVQPDPGERLCCTRFLPSCPGYGEGWYISAWLARRGNPARLCPCSNEGVHPLQAGRVPNRQRPRDKAARCPASPITMLGNIHAFRRKLEILVATKPFPVTLTQDAAVRNTFSRCGSMQNARLNRATAFNLPALISAKLCHPVFAATEFDNQTKPN